MRHILAVLLFAGAALAASPALADDDDDRRGREHKYHEWNDGRGGHDRRDDRWRHDRRGPPPHAPAWGYRDRHDQYDRHDRYRDDRYYDDRRAIIIRGFGGELVITPDSRAYGQLLGAPYGFRPNYVYQYSNDCGPRGCRVRVYDPHRGRDYGWISAPRPPRDCWDNRYSGYDDRTYRRW